MRYYQSIDTISIYLFNKIIETGNKRYLIKVDDIEYLPNNVNDEKLETIWEFINESYQDEINKTRKRNNKSDIIKHIMRLNIDKLIIQQHLIVYEMNPKDTDNLKFLISRGYVPTPQQKNGTLNDRLTFVKEVNRRLSAIDGRISILRRELEQEEKAQSEDDSTFDDLVIIAEKHLGRRIDVMQTSVKEWIHIENSLLKSVKNDKGKE